MKRRLHRGNYHLSSYRPVGDLWHLATSLPPNLKQSEVKLELAIATDRASKILIDLLDGTQIQLYLPSTECTVSECFDYFELKLDRQWPRRNVHWKSVWKNMTFATAQGVLLLRNDATKLRATAGNSRLSMVVMLSDKKL